MSMADMRRAMLSSLHFVELSISSIMFLTVQLPLLKVLDPLGAVLDDTLGLSGAMAEEQLGQVLAAVPQSTA